MDLFRLHPYQVKIDTMPSVMSTPCSVVASPISQSQLRLPERLSTLLLELDPSLTAYSNKQYINFTVSDQGSAVTGQVRMLHARHRLNVDWAFPDDTRLSSQIIRFNRLRLIELDACLKTY